MDNPSTSSSADEQPAGQLHADDTALENFNVLQPGESPPRAIGMQTKARSLGKTRGSSGKAPVPTTVEVADIPTRHIAIKADTPKKREESRKNDVLVEQQMKATRVNTDARLDAIARRVHSVKPEPAPRPIASTADVEPIDWGVVAVGAAGAILLGVSVYFLIKNLIGSNVSASASPAAAASEAVRGAYPPPAAI
jgi:hypothetical protein